MTTPSEPTLEQPDDSEVLDMAAARKLRNECASWRVKARDAEARAHTLEEQYGEAAAIVSAMQLSEVKRIAGEVLHDPDDLIAHQPDMAAYFDDEFKAITADKVVEQAKELIRQRPHLGKPPETPPRPPSDRPIEGLRGGASPESKPKPVTWSSAIRG